MKALTLWRPWPWAIFHCPSGPKRIENRGWAPPGSIVGQRIAIHAGKRFDLDAVDWIRSMGPRCPDPEQHPLGVVGVATVVGCVYAPLGDMPLSWSGRVTEGQARAVYASRWFVGPIGWVLDDVVALAEPVPCKGAQGLWDVPAEVEARVLAQVGGGR